jgi:uncharacterized protein with FMN-binding domain
MKPWLIITLVVIAVIVAGAVIFYQSLNSRLKHLTAPASDPDLSEIADGTYHGKYSAFPVVVEVSVTVKDHAITKIVLIKHQNGQGSGAEVIPNEVVKSQTLQVDTVSGATYSSKVILNAIEDALLRAKK